MNTNSKHPSCIRTFAPRCAALLLLAGCGGGPGSATYTTKDHGTETLTFGSALVDHGTSVAFVGCKPTCDVMSSGTVNWEKLPAVCPGNFRYVRVIFVNRDGKELKEIPVGSYDKKTGPVRVQSELVTKDNTGRGFNESTANDFHVDVATSGAKTKVTFLASDPGASLNGSFTAEVCPAK